MMCIDASYLYFMFRCVFVGASCNYLNPFIYLWWTFDLLGFWIQWNGVAFNVLGLTLLIYQVNILVSSWFRYSMAMVFSVMEEVDYNLNQIYRVGPPFERHVIETEIFLILVH